MRTNESKILAKAIYEIRLLLSGYLGSNVDADPSVRIAAHLAYALHNDALAVLEGNGFSADEALKRVAAVDSLLGVEAGVNSSAAWKLRAALPGRYNAGYSIWRDRCGRAVPGGAGASHRG